MQVSWLLNAVVDAQVQVAEDPAPVATGRGRLVGAAVVRELGPSDAAFFAQASFVIDTEVKCAGCANVVLVKHLYQAFLSESSGQHQCKQCDQTICYTIPDAEIEEAMKKRTDEQYGALAADEEGVCDLGLSGINPPVNTAADKYLVVEAAKKGKRGKKKKAKKPPQEKGDAPNSPPDMMPPVSLPHAHQGCGCC